MRRVLRDGQTADLRFTQIVQVGWFVHQSRSAPDSNKNAENRSRDIGPLRNLRYGLLTSFRHEFMNCVLRRMNRCRHHELRCRAWKSNSIHESEARAYGAASSLSRSGRSLYLIGGGGFNRPSSFFMLSYLKKITAFLSSLRTCGFASLVFFVILPSIFIVV